MIKGVHQLTLRPNMLTSVNDQFTIFNGWMDNDGQPGGPRRGSRIFCQRGGGVGVKARRPEYRIRTWDNVKNIHARACRGIPTRVIILNFPMKMK